MALPTVAEVKVWLRIDATITDEDTLLSDLLAGAIAAFETEIRRPILGAGRTFGPVRAAYPTVRGLRVSDVPNSPYLTHGTDEFGRSTDGLVESADVSGPASMDSLSDYSARWEPLIRRALMDLVTEYYEHRNSHAISEPLAGGNVSYGRTQHGIPPRVRATIEMINNLSVT